MINYTKKNITNPTNCVKTSIPKAKSPEYTANREKLCIQDKHTR